MALTEAPSVEAATGDPLLQPLKLRHLTLRNRIFSTSHAIRFGVDGLPQERYQL